LDRGAPNDIRKKVEKVMKGDTIFIRKGQILVYVAKQEACEVDIYKLQLPNGGKKKEQEGQTIKRAKTIPNYNKYMLRVHLVIQRMQDYPLPRKKLFKVVSKGSIFLPA
jgi:hypothetical protein